MSLLRNVLTYMGLGPDEDYEDGYGYDAADGELDLTDDNHDNEAGSRRRAGRHSARSTPPDPPAPTEADRTAPASRTFDPQTDLDVESAPAGGEGPLVIDQRSIDQRSIDQTGASPDASVRPLRAVPPSPGPDEHHDDGITIRSVSPFEEDPKAGVAGFDDRSDPRYVKPRALSPRSFGDAATLADEFKGGTPVIMNLQGIERELARRLIDFASGICYALDGSMEKVASQVFLLTPQTVEVSDEDRRLIGEDRYGP